MIRKRDLGRMEFIAEGAVGSVYRLLDFRLPGFTDLAYKEVKSAGGGLSPDKRRQALDAMRRSVEFRAGLVPADRDDLDEYTTWPVDLVEDADGACGCVMPLISPDFFLTTRPPDGTSSQVVFELSWLSAKEAQAQAVGIDRSGIQEIVVRIALLAQLVYAVGRLHRHGAVYGDLSLKNAALAVDPPRVKLLDCDAVAALTDPHRVQLHSPFFTPPECTADPARLQDDRTDVYKLGLCVIRGLQQGAGVTQTKEPAGLAGKLDAAAVDVVARAVGPNPSDRPSAKELFSCLERSLHAKAAPPELQSASLSRTAIPRGTDVEVVWEATGGRNVRIQGSNGLEVELADTGSVPARRRVVPKASGEITVEVLNDHGAVRAVAGEVLLFDLPSFALDPGITFPRPTVGRLPDIELPAAHRAVPAIPDVSTSGHPIPRVSAPPLTPVSDVLAAIRGVPAPLDGLATVHEAVTDVAGAARRVLEPGLADAPFGVSATRAVADVSAVLDASWVQMRVSVENEMRTANDRRAAAS